VYSLNKPTPAQIAGFIAEQSTCVFSYQPVGATCLQALQKPRYLPPGHVIDQRRVQLGAGAGVFAAARQALQRWAMFETGWTSVFPPTPVIEEGTVVAILACVPGLWSLNAVRIVYTLTETGAVERHGFAYGTLPDHVKQGEERFTVEWDHRDDSVWYDVLAFSRPNRWLSHLGQPVIRRLQYRFGVASLHAMQGAVAGQGS